MAGIGRDRGVHAPLDTFWASFIQRLRMCVPQLGSHMFSLPGPEQGAVVEDAGRTLDLVRAGKSLSCGTLADSYF